MAHFKKVFQKIGSILCNFSLILNIFLPYFAVIPAHAADISPISYSDSTHKLSFSFDNPSSLSYQLFYKSDTKIDAVAGNSLPGYLFLGTCSSGSCLPQNFDSAILKTKSGSDFHYYYFTLKDGQLQIVKEGTSSQFDLSDEENNLLENGPTTPSSWTFEKVELDREYESQGVKLTFTRLPENSGNIKVEEITLTPEQIKQTGSLSDKAYDITSDMADGSFAYNLTLPIPESAKNKNVDVKFAEDISEINSAQTVDNVEPDNDSILVKNIDHFTIFIITHINLATNPSPNVVRVNDFTKWFFYNDETDVIDNTLGEFVTGPLTPPQGSGSVKLSVIGTQRRNIATYQFAGTKLKDITSLGYSTYNPSAGNGGSANRSGYLNFNVSFDGSDSWQKRIAFIPSKNGTVIQNSWQYWDAINSGNALWWWSGYSANSNKWPDGNASEYRTWNNLLTAFPNIAIRSGDSWVGIRVGEPYTDGYTEYIDNFTFGTSSEVKVFDFEKDLPIPACNNSSFDNSSLGSVNGKDGWSSTGNYDQSIVSNTYGFPSFGCKVLRLSNAVTSGSFGDQTFSFSNANEAGETLATNGGQSSGTRQNHYEAQFDFASTQLAQQLDLSISVSPDRGDGSRMSYLRFVDDTDGIDVFFDDVSGTTSPVNFNETKVAENLSRTTTHTAKFVIDFVDGPSNDVVKIYIDGSLFKIGTTWENYYRYDTEASAEQGPRTTDNLLFRAGGDSVSANNGKGFLFDNISLSSSTIDTTAPQINNLKYYKNGSLVTTPSTTPIFVKSIDDLTYSADYQDNFGLNRTAFVIWDATDTWEPVSNSHKCNWNGSPSTTILNSTTSQTLSGILLKQCNPSYSWPSGKYIISHIVYDNAGNSTYNTGGSQRFIIDNTAPNVNFVNPTPENESYVKGNITGRVTATDNVGMGSYYIRVWKNAFESGNLVKECSSAPGGNLLGTSQEVSCSLDTANLDDGKYVFSAQFLDSSNNWGTAFRTFYVDNTAPVGGSMTMTTNLFPSGITVTSPDSNGVYLLHDLSMDGADQFRTLKVAVTDPNLDTTNVQVYVDETPNGYMIFDNNTNIWNYGMQSTVPSFLSGIQHNLVATFKDKAGNNKQLTVRFTTDNTAPVITVNKFITNDNTPKITGTINDSTAVISVKINEKSYTANNNGSTWELADNTINPALADGTYDVIATATDVAGNVGTESTINGLTIDSVAPTATYKHYIGDTEFTGPIAYVKNLNQLSFTGKYTDDVPSSGLKQDSFVIFQAQNDHSFGFQNSGKQAYCSWRTGDNTIALSGSSATLEKIAFTKCVADLSEGEYYMSHQVYDNAVRQDIPSITQYRDVLGLHFIIDSNAPQSRITTPANSSSGSILYLSKWTGSILGTATDSLSQVKEVKVSIKNNSGNYFNGSSFSESSEYLLPTTYTAGNWEYSGFTSPVEDTYTIQSHAIDNAGNTENTYTLTIVLDKTIPEVDITLNPVNPDADNGWYKTQPEITLKNNDPNIAKIQYKWDSGTWQDYTGPFKLENEGAHVLYYKATDLAGNNTSENGVKNIAWDQTDLEYGPQNISANPNPTSGSTSKIKWEVAKDNTGIDKYEVQWKLNDVTNPPSYSKTVGSGTTEVEIDQLTEGRWTVKVVAFDGSGRSKDNSIDVVVDRSGPVAPVLTLTGTGAGTATLSWNAIVDAQDYIIWYGNAPGSRQFGAKVGNVTSYTVRGLGGGNYYFIVRAVDGAQNQGADSNEVSTGTIAGAAGVAPGTPAEGFNSSVLGATTEDLTPTPTLSPSVSNVLGVSTENMGTWWWLWLLLLIPLYFVFRRLTKHHRND